LPFASSYRLITTWFSTVTFLQRTFTSLVHAHAGRTQSNQKRTLRALGHQLASAFGIFASKLLPFIAVLELR
jgi:hypothetical protein